jgi:hypothetical protein
VGRRLGTGARGVSGGAFADAAPAESLRSPGHLSPGRRSKPLTSRSSTMPRCLARKCAGLKHVAFLGTRARSYTNPDELAEFKISVHLINGYGDTAVAESTIALMWAPRASSRRLTARCALVNGRVRTACSSPVKHSV